jgi:predicted metalloprotease with PDZ domain
VFLFIPGHTREAVTLEIAVPARWQVATGLEPLGGGNGIFRFRARRL